ncbi:intelectin-1b-like [Styela clava]
MASHKFAPPPSSRRDPSIDYRYIANEETLNEAEGDLYENVTYVQPRAIQGTSNNTTVETKTPKCTPINVVLSIAVVISNILSVCGIILVIQVDNRLERAIEKLSKTSTPASSCFRIKAGGQNHSEFYTIHPTSSPSFFKVFCDMESAGGGWTLVASVHRNESGVKYKYTGQSIGTRDGYGLWENYLAFGTPENAHKKDFKSPAYFSLQLWHVITSGSVQNHINGGGSDMFDGGNKIFYRIGDDPEVQVTYNEKYR